MTTQPLAGRLDELADPSYEPTTQSDRWRAALLRGETITPDDVPHHSGRAHLANVVKILEDLGVPIERTREGGGKVTYRGARRNGSRAADVEVVPAKNGHRKRSRSLREIAKILPPLASDLVVVAVGFTPDGAPFLIATDEIGTRFSCSIEQAEPPRS